MPQVLILMWPSKRVDLVKAKGYSCRKENREYAAPWKDASARIASVRPERLSLCKNVSKAMKPHSMHCFLLKGRTHPVQTNWEDSLPLIHRRTISAWTMTRKKLSEAVPEPSLLTRTFPLWSLLR